MSCSLLCRPLCVIYDCSSRQLTNTIFTVLLQVREGPSSLLSAEAWQREMEAEKCPHGGVPLTDGTGTSLCEGPAQQEQGCPPASSSSVPAQAGCQGLRLSALAAVTPQFTAIAEELGLSSSSAEAGREISP